MWGVGVPLLGHCCAWQREAGRFCGVHSMAWSTVWCGAQHGVLRCGMVHGICTAWHSAKRGVLQCGMAHSVACYIVWHGAWHLHSVVWRTAWHTAWHQALCGNGAWHLHSVACRAWRAQHGLAHSVVRCTVWRGAVWHTAWHAQRGMVHSMACTVWHAPQHGAVHSMACYTLWHNSGAQCDVGTWPPGRLPLTVPIVDRAGKGGTGPSCFLSLWRTSVDELGASDTMHRLPSAGEGDSPRTWWGGPGGAVPGFPHFCAVVWQLVRNTKLKYCSFLFLQRRSAM